MFGPVPYRLPPHAKSLAHGGRSQYAAGGPEQCGLLVPRECLLK
jgi:hypothetical protein